MRTLIVEGWRFIPHSYAMVSQQISLELLARSGIQLLHRDLPFLLPTWRAEPGLWPADLEARLRAIPPAVAGESADALLRVGAPYFFHQDPGAKRTFVFTTTEFKHVPELAIGAGIPAREALARTGATIITCSKWAAEGLIGSGAPRDKVVVVPLGVDPRFYAPADPARRAALRRQFAWEGKFVILNLGAMTVNKGIAGLLKAFAAIVERFPQAQLMLKGADDVYPSHPNLVNAFAMLSAEELARVHPRVSYTGSTLATQEIAALMQAADLYVSPYLAEGFNLPVLEAAACGLPVICTRGGSTEDFISDDFAWRIDSREVPGPDGGVMLLPDAVHLADLLARAVSDIGFRERAAASGPRWAAERYTWKHTVDKLLQVML